MIAAALTAAGPRSPLAPAVAGAAGLELAQTPEGDLEGEEVEEEDVPIPPNLLEPEPSFVDSATAARAAADSLAARKAAADSLGASRSAADTLGAFRAEPPETLHSVPPGAVIPEPVTGAPRNPVTKPGKGLFGLTPFMLLLGLAAVHILVVRTVGD